MLAVELTLSLDQLMFFGTVDSLPTRPTKIVIKPTGTHFPHNVHFTIPFDPRADLAKGEDKASLFQLKAERERPDPAAVRLKKVRESMVKRGVIAGGTSFYARGTVCMSLRFTCLISSRLVVALYSSYLLPSMFSRITASRPRRFPK